MILVLLTSLPRIHDTYAQSITPDKPEIAIELKKENADKKMKDSEWGDWNNKNSVLSKYGVGIKGAIESELSQLDKSDLLNNATGVATSKAAIKKLSKELKDIKSMMKELEAIEAELTKELSDDTEF